MTRVKLKVKLVVLKIVYKLNLINKWVIITWFLADKSYLR
jgi:hypothetical protein